jgi:hypothetical protein
VRHPLLPRLAAGLLALLLAAATVAAAEPTAAPTETELPQATESSEPTESPEVTEAPETPEPTESPEATEAPALEPADEELDEDELDEDEGPPSQAKLDAVVEKLAALGVAATADELAALAAERGFGQAVKALLFAEASGRSVGEILEMRDSGMGWGRIRKDLELSINPGIGRIMGNGHGLDQVRDRAAGGGPGNNGRGLALGHDKD